MALAENLPAPKAAPSKRRRRRRKRKGSATPAPPDGAQREAASANGGTPAEAAPVEAPVAEPAES
jgi:hypothetical protein